MEKRIKELEEEYEDFRKKVTSRIVKKEKETEEEEPDGQKT